MKIIFLTAIIILISIIFLIFIKQFNSKSPIIKEIPSIERLTSYIPNSPEVSFWMSYFDTSRALESYSKNQENLNYIMPLVFTLNTDLTIETTNIDINKVFENKKDKVKVLATLTNDLDTERVNRLLNERNSWATLNLKIIELLKGRNYYGLDLDFENISLENKDAFNDFAKLLNVELEKNNYYFSITVQAQTDTSNIFGQDLGSLSEIADEIRIMAYDLHTAETEPGSIIPISDLENIIEYSIKYIPIDKLNLALPTYGYDWSESNAHSLQYQDIQNLIEKYPNGESKFDDETGSVYLRYNISSNKHIVWYENEKSLKLKTDIAKSYGINKFSFWRIGGETPVIWDLF